MNENIDLGEPYCPGCSEVDPTCRGVVAVIAWCGSHKPMDTGIDDEKVTATIVTGILSEADGDACRSFADWQRQGFRVSLCSDNNTT